MGKAKLTPGRQLAQERAMIVRHIQRVGLKSTEEVRRALADIVSWIRERDERYNKKPRGLGK